MSEHKCKRQELKWDTEPIIDEGVSFRGTCPTCGKVYEQVFTENDGLYDPEKEEYVYI